MKSEGNIKTFKESVLAYIDKKEFENWFQDMGDFGSKEFRDNVLSIMEDVEKPDTLHLIIFILVKKVDELQEKAENLHDRVNELADLNGLPMVAE